MNPQIKKFRFKIALEMILKNFLYSLSIGLFSCSIILFLIKIALLKIPYLYSVYIGIGLFVGCFIILCILNRPTEMRIAKRLDQDLNLNEKVKTMVHFKDSKQPMLVVQRENTMKILDTHTSKQIPFKIAILGLLITFISSGTLTVSALIPQRVVQEKPPISDSPSTSQNPSDTGGDKISQNINQLEFSRIDEIIKNKLLEILRNVYEVYNDTSLSKDYKIEFIKKAIFDVDDIMEKDLSKNLICKAFQFTALTNAIGVAIENGNQEELNSAFNAIYGRLFFLTGTGLDRALLELSKTIDEDLALVTKEVREDDELYVVFKDFAKTLNTYAKKTNKKNIKEEITMSIEKIKVDVWTALNHQFDALEMCEEVQSTLISLLNQLDPPPQQEPDENQSGSASTIPTPSQDNSSQTSQDSTSQTSSSEDASGGSQENPGEVVFDKTDIIFDPDSNTNVEYSQIIEEYYQQIIALIQDNHLDMSVEEVINTYFNYLYHPNQNNNEEETENKN